MLSVKNRVVREPDDAMAAALGIEGVETLDDYAGRIIQAQRSEAFDSVLRDMLLRIRDAVISGSEFILCKEDWARCVKLELEYCRAVAAQEGLKLEEMTPEQFAGRVPVKGYYEFIAMLQDSAWEKLCEGLLGRYYAAADGFDVTEAEYEAQLADYAKDWRLSDEAARAVQGVCAHTRGPGRRDTLPEHRQGEYRRLPGACERAPHQRGTHRTVL